MEIIIDEHTEDSPLVVRRRQVQEALEEVQKGARARTLNSEHVDEFYRAYRTLRTRARRDDIPLEALYVRISGGGVAHSYKYRADTTSINVRNGVLSVERGRVSTNGKNKGTITGGFRGPGHGGIRIL